MEVDETAVTDDYMKKIPDTAKIREALTAGKTLPFAELKERGEHLRIK
ncbi:MAG: siphovirus Gp157 family protein [Gallintestinimicrobium sp.]